MKNLSYHTFLIISITFLGLIGTNMVQAQTASITVNSNASCNGESDGELTASATGGTSPYTYAWSNSSTTANITGLAANTYTVTVTDATGATATESATVTEPNLLRWWSITIRPVSCNGGSDGDMGVVFTGGTTPYSYSWNHGGTSDFYDNLSAGSYKVTTTDANGCTATTYTYSVTEPSVLTPSISITHPSTNGGTDGALSASASGGNGTYTYAWSNNASGSSISGLSAGTYTVTVTDKKGCTGTSSVTVLDPPSLSISTHDNISCNGETDGKLTATASSGGGSYTYAWSNSSSSASISSLSKGTYTVTVTDANGLTATESATITEPNLLRWWSITIRPVTCNGGSDGDMGVVFTGGTTPYSYSWSHGGTLDEYTNLSAGSYKVTTTDANGCTATTYTYSVTEPSALTASLSTTNESSSSAGDGAVSASVSGGNGTNTYSWSTGGSSSSISSLSAGTYTLTVTDKKGCTTSETATVYETPSVSITTNNHVSCNGNSDGQLTAVGSGGGGSYTYAWSNSGSSASISSLSGGTYTVTVTDANGLTATESATITEPTALTASITTNSGISTAGASDGQLTASGSGGTTSYTYAWSNSGSTASISSLSAATYTVTITDANGCTATASETLADPPSPEIAISGNGIEITDGDATPRIKDHTYFGSVDATSDTKTRTFTISNSGDAALSLSGSPKVAVSGTNSSDFSVTTQPSSSSISASSSLTFVVEFDPSAEGVREATLTITNNDGDEGTYDFAISGLGSSKADYPFEWTWVGGSSTKDAVGVYGTKGTASSSNIPGARRSAMTWKDASDNVYVFGGYGLDKNGDEGHLNDLWKFDGSQWTWLSGSDTRNSNGVYGTMGTASSSNVPGARWGSIGYIDGSGNLWLFGGNGYYGSTSSTGNMNDLWKWDGTNWTWVGGDNDINKKSTYGTTGQYSSSTWPRGSSASNSWYDGNGIFWMLGGWGRDKNNQGGPLNDLWKWNGSQWAFVGGSKTRKPAGVYGTKGTASSSNWPGGRRYSANWVDASNNLWMFGGHGPDKTTNNGYMNDLWKYDGSQWTWVSGDDDRNQSGSYGTQGKAASSNVPGSRRWSSYWLDGSGNMTIYGGYGYDASGNLGELNDMWVWDGTNWAWTSGEKTYQEPGNFGTQGTASSDNYPGAVYGAVSWIDKNGNLWTMGGDGIDANGSQGYMNDIWKMDMAYIWDGTSTTWTTNGNWKNGGVANSNYPVRIPSGLGTYPTLSSNTTLCDIEIENGASLSIGSGNTLTITNTFEYKGSSALNLGDGTLKLNGTSAQTIDGPITGNVEVDNSSDVSLGGNSTINTLTLTNGDLDIGNNNLTLGSASGGSSSSYIKISGTGKVTAEVGSSPVTLPVGRNPYLPIIIDDGGGANFTVGVSQNVYDNPETQSGQKTSNVVGETWTIQSDQTANNVSVTLQWNASEETTGFTRSSSMVGFWEHGVSTQWDANATLGSASGSDPYSLSRTVNFTTNLFYFGVGSNGSALPVEFTYFQAEWLKQGESAQLSWQTAMEENNSHFEIERALSVAEGSGHDLNWEQIGRVEGAGNSMSPINYAYTDQLESQNQKLETIYYRLKQVDYNGNFEYSEIRTLRSTQEDRNTISIYPNPASNVVNINSHHPIEKVEVLNLQGQVILSSEKDSRTLDISSLAAGTYLIRTLASGQVQQQKLRVN